MSACSRPVLETQTYARRTFARCLSCSRLSPPGQDAVGPWATTHRSEAVAANCEIGDKAGAVRVA